MYTDGNENDRDLKNMLINRLLSQQTHNFSNYEECRGFQLTKDDTLSSNYPNSYSTIRDLTSSSISSAFGLKKSFSFNDDDENEIAKDMRNLSNSTELLFSNIGTDEKYSDKCRNRQNLSAQKNYEIGNISDSSPSTVISCSRINYSNKFRNRNDSDTISRKSEIFDAAYSKEYLSLAMKFGSVVTAMRKPGHHTGPTKNPDCQCEHCKIWFFENQQIENRARATSIDSPITQTTFWKKNHRHYV